MERGFVRWRRWVVGAVAACLSLLASTSVFAGGLISNYGGGGLGSGAPAENITMRAWAMTNASNGALYFTDPLRGVVWKVATDGRASIIAGTHPAYLNPTSFAGDGGPATKAVLNWPSGIVRTPDGTFYISDTGNQRIRKIDTAGKITTFAGTGEWGYTGDGGPAKHAKLFNPRGLVRDSSGNLFVVDNQRIRKITPGGTISTFSSAVVGGQYHLAIDKNNNLYHVTWNGDHGEAVYRVTPSGAITRVAGGGPPGTPDRGDGGSALLASLSAPTGMAIASDGTLYIAEGVYGRVRKVTPAGIITTIAGGVEFSREPGDVGDGGPAYEADLDVTGLGFNADQELLVLDQDRVRAIDAEGIIRTVFGSGLMTLGGDEGPANLANVHGPLGVDHAPNGDVYVVTASMVRRITPDGTIHAFAGDGYNLHRGDGGPATEASLRDPISVAVGPDGSVYIGGTGTSGRIRKVDAEGVITTVVGTGEPLGFSGDGGPANEAQITGAMDIAFDNDGNLLFTDSGNARVRRVTPQGQISTIAGDGTWASTGDFGPAALAQLDNPFGLDVTADDDIFIGELHGERVRRIDGETGIITTFAGTGQQADTYYGEPGRPAITVPIDDPMGIAADNDNVFFSDQRGFVSKVNCAGIISTVVGKGYGESAGDGGLATNAEIRTPRGVELSDEEGDLFVAHGLDPGHVRLVDKIYPKRYTPLPVDRLVDTRNGTGGRTGRLGSASTMSFNVLGRGGVPSSGVAAVVMNLVSTSPNATSNLTAFPAGTRRPGTPQVHFVAGQTRANLVTVPVGSAGKVSVYNKTGSTHVLADVVGWYSDGSVALNGGSFYPVPPSRLEDTRLTGGPIGPGGIRTVPVAGRGGVPALGASSVVLNVKALQGTATSKLTAYPTGTATPPEADVFFDRGNTVAKLVTVPLTENGSIDIHNASGSAHAIVDVVGWYGASCPLVTGSSFAAVPSSRIVSPSSTHLGPQEDRAFTVAGKAGVPHAANAVLIDLTAVSPTRDGALTVYPSDRDRTSLATLHFRAGRTVSNLALVPIGEGKSITVYNSAGTTRIAVDVLGYFHLES